MRVKELISLLGSYDHDSEVRLAWCEHDTYTASSQDLVISGATTEFAPTCPVKLRVPENSKTVWLFAARHIEIIQSRAVPANAEAQQG